MAPDDECSSKSSLFGDEFKPKPLNYEELGDDCHYVLLRNADPIKMKSKSKNVKKASSAKKSTLKTLEQKKIKIKKEMKALMKKPKLPEDKIEVIDLISDDENTTEQLTPVPPIQSPKMPSPGIQSLKVKASKGQMPRIKTSPDSPYDRLTDSSDEPCKHCKECQRRKRRRICKEEYEIDSNDSNASRRKRDREKLREAAKRHNINMMRSKRDKESPINNFLYEEPPLKAFHDVEEAFGDFRCRVCNIEVHSEVTLQTHLVGRKHLKTLKAQAIPEVAMQSLEQFSSKPSSCISFENDDQPLHYPPPAPGMTRIRVKKIAKLQSVAKSYRKHPITGLTYVTEIHLPNEVIYYCELCDANCTPNTIMCHLIGFKHKLNFVRIKYPIMYERVQYKPKRDIENEMMKLLIDYDRTHGRGLIKVEEEVDDIRLSRRRHGSRRRSYSPHRGNCGCKSCSEVQVQMLGCNDRGRRNVAGSLSTEDLDVSMADYFCKVCDSHMNNEQMWEAHVRGRRHLKNKKKRPGENPSKIKNIHCPGEKPKLMNDLQEIREPIVGLNYVQEVQGRAGNQYKCFLCGACCTSFDIIDHLVSEKHRMKLLEAENKKGRKNGFETILNLSFGMSPSIREKLVAQEAANFQREYGRGKMLVYKSKDIYPDFYGQY